MSFSVAVAVVTVMAVLETRKSPYAAFARSRLVDPATVISTAYGPPDSKLKPALAVRELFGHETGEDRLSVAVFENVEGLPIVRRPTLDPMQSPSYLGTPSEK